MEPKTISEVLDDLTDRVGAKDYDALHLLTVAWVENRIRDAFMAGWFAQATNEQTLDYLCNCEQVDWDEYQRLGLKEYMTVGTVYGELYEAENHNAD